MSTEAEVNLSFYLQDTEENNSTDELPLSVEDAKPTKVCVYCVYCVYCVGACIKPQPARPLNVGELIPSEPLPGFICFF